MGGTAVLWETDPRGTVRRMRRSWWLASTSLSLLMMHTILQALWVRSMMWLYILCLALLGLVMVMRLGVYPQANPFGVFIQPRLQRYASIGAWLGPLFFLATDILALFVDPDLQAIILVALSGAGIILGLRCHAIVRSILWKQDPLAAWQPT